MVEIDTKTYRVLRKLSVSLCQHDVMCTVGYRIPLIPEELAEHTAVLVEGDSRGNFAVPEYRKAIEQCIQKSWLEIITPVSYEAEGRRQQHSNLLELYDTGFEPGTVDFTQKGYSVFRQSILEIFGKRHIQYDDSGWNVERQNCRIDFLAETAGWCRRRIAEFMFDPSMCVGQAVKITTVTKPIRVGSWKPNKFIVLQQGFHATMKYKVQPDAE